MTDKRIVVLEPANCDAQCQVLRDIFKDRQDVVFISEKTQEGLMLSRMLYNGTLTSSKMLVMKETTVKELSGE